MLGFELRGTKLAGLITGYEDHATGILCVALEHEEIVRQAWQDAKQIS